MNGKTVEDNDKWSRTSIKMSATRATGLDAILDRSSERSKGALRARICCTNGERVQMMTGDVGNRHLPKLKDMFYLSPLAVRPRCRRSCVTTLPMASS